MRGLGRRIERLEELADPVPQKRGPWPVEDQLEDVLDILWDHRNGRYTYAATDRELRLMASMCAGEEITGTVESEDLPEGVREYFDRMDPREQPARERYLYERRRLPEEPNARERVRLEEERVRAYVEESKRRDRAMLEENRRACSLPPLSPEQLRDGGPEA